MPENQRWDGGVRAGGTEKAVSSTDENARLLSKIVCCMVSCKMFSKTGIPAESGAARAWTRVWVSTHLAFLVDQDPRTRFMERTILYKKDRGSDRRTC